MTVKAADDFKRQHGTLTVTERQKIKEEITTNRNTDASAKDRGK